MNIFGKLIFLVFCMGLVSCSNNEIEVSLIEDKDIELQMIDAY